MRVREAAELCIAQKYAGTSLLVRRLKMTYIEAVQVIEILEILGVISSFSGEALREVYVTKEQLNKILKDTSYD